MLQCSISECKHKALETVKISFRETRNLCKEHYNFNLTLSYGKHVSDRLLLTI